MNNNKTLKPYLISSFYKWSLDYNLTPLIEVVEDYYNKLPEKIKNQTFTILNIHSNATYELTFEKEHIAFEAIFNGESFKVIVTYESIQKIFTKEDGYGLEFSVDKEKILKPYNEKKKPYLKLIKF